MLVMEEDYTLSIYLSDVLTAINTAYFCQRALIFKKKMEISAM